MRTIPINQQNRQDSPNQKCNYKVEIKPSEASLEAYEDITEHVLKLTIRRNIEGSPNKASMTVKSSSGIFDITNIKSVDSRKFQEGAKVKISIGYVDADILIFTGYVSAGYRQKYQAGKAEKITVTLEDRGGSCSGTDYQTPIDTIIYNDMTPAAIIEEILTTYGGMASEDIYIDEELDNDDEEDPSNLIVRNIQFMQESIWDIIQMCCHTRLHAGYFATDGSFHTMPLQFTTPDFSATSINNSGTPTMEIDDSWNTKDLASEVVVIGNIKFPGRDSERIVVINVNPNYGIRAYGQSNFENFTTLRYGRVGNPWYDSFMGRPDDPTYIYNNWGVGFQGTFIPLDMGADPIGKFGDGDYWRITVQGPFPWTSGTFSYGLGTNIQYAMDGIPNEPYQMTKTGIGDSQGATGYFPTYNNYGGTNITIDVDTLNLEEIFKSNMLGMVWNEAQYFFDILPSADEWELFQRSWGITSNFIPYPSGASGPTTDQYYTVCFSWCKDTFTSGIGSEWVNCTFPWGMKYSANWTDLPAIHYTGTYTDSELYGLYGTSRHDEVENPLLFSDANCGTLAEMIVDRAKKFHIQCEITRVSQLSLDPGDLIDYYNPGTDCVLRICLTSIEYNMEVGKKFEMVMTGGVISSEGTTVKAWRQ